MMPDRLFPLVAGLVFAVALTQPPLYYSNQNQYFLHAAALAGVGDLATDWLATTADPTPLFTAGATLALRFFGPWAVSCAFLILGVVYFHSLWVLLQHTPFAPRSRSGAWLWAALLTAMHAGALRAASVALTGVDYPWYFQAGVANQYLLGAGLQPSLFGVFLLTALAAYAAGRPRGAALALALACTLHSTYLLTGGLIAVGILAVELSAGRYRDARGFALRAIVGVLPVVGYTVYLFRPFTDAALTTEAQRILAVERLPHHCDPCRFFDWCAWLQLHGIGAGLYFIRAQNWGRALLIATLAAVSLSLLQVATENHALALLFPWRLSAVLVPVATAILAAIVVRRLERFPAIGLKLFAGSVLVTCLIGAFWVTTRGLAHPENPAESGVIEFLAAHRQPGDQVLLPTKVPPRAGRLRLTSASFVPIAPVSRPFFELQSFRLATGAAIYVDFKSIPYAPADVVEWLRRVRQVEAWYAQPNWNAATLAEVRAAGITHVVIPSGTPLTAPGLEVIYRDDWYAVAAIRP